MKEEIIYPNHGLGLPFEIVITGTSYCDGSYYIKRSCSEVMTVEYIVSGSGKVKCNGKTFYPKAGDMYVLPIGSQHEYRSYSDEPWVKIWFNAKGELCEHILDMYKIGMKFFYESCDGGGYIKKIHKICSDCSFSDTKKQNKSALCAIELFQFLAAEKTMNEKKECEIIKEYIDAHISEGIGIADMAEFAGLSVSQTIRVFKKEFKMTPYEYLTARRIEKARLLLGSTNMKIKDISKEVGFCDVHYFSGVFGKRCAETPGNYRKRMQRGEKVD